MGVMRYREETGTVTELDGDKAAIRLDADAGARCGFCCACSMAASGARTLKVNAKGLAPGDRVMIRIPRYSGYVSMLLLFVLPLGLFVVGMSLGMMLEPEGAGHGFSPIVGALLGLGVALLIAWLAERRLSRHAIEVHRVRENPSHLG